MIKTAREGEDDKKRRREEGDKREVERVMNRKRVIE